MGNYFLDIQYIWIVKHFRHTDRSLELLREAAKNVISLVARPLRPSPKTPESCTDFGIRKKTKLEMVHYFLDRQYEVQQLFCIVN